MKAFQSTWRLILILSLSLLSDMTIFKFSFYKISYVQRSTYC